MLKKVLFDTDIGSDIDDAVALAYLLANPECELLGITTVSGKPDLRARMVSAMCTAARADVPIIVGSGSPLSGPLRQPEVPQATALSRWPHETEFDDIDAPDFMADVIRANPGEVTLLAVGPMTNVAHLFDRHPDTPPIIRELVLMLGHFRPEQPERGEWNSYNDPHAAQRVYNAPVAVHRSLGLDVTRQVRMSAGEVRERFSAPLLAPVRDFAEVWFDTRNERPLTFHDPLAAATVFQPDLCGYERGRADVIVDDIPEIGTTLWSPEVGGPHEIGITVDRERFFDHYFDVLDGFSLP